MKENSSIQSIQNNWIVRLANRSILVVTLASLLLLVLRWPQLPPFVPLWYSLPWGNDQLAAPIWLFVLPLGSTIIFGLNTAISAYIIIDNLIFIQLSYVTSLLVSFLSFITLVKILALVT